MSSAITSVLPRTKVAISREYHRVEGANILVYEPAERVAGAEHVILVSMHGGLNATLESKFLERVASYGFRTAFCVPDKSSFIDQFRVMDHCMTLFREIAGTIVLLGQSRGAALMSGYQKIAENGVGVFQGPERLLPLPDMELEPADALMLLDANFGTTIMHLMSLNPALVTEGRATLVDSELDATNPANGYAPNAQADYSPEFKSRFLGAQRARYNALLATARTRWEAIQAGEGDYSDNEPFIVPDGIGINNSPKLFAGDLRIFSHTKDAWPLIHRDGSITTQIVPCVREDENNPGLAGTMRGALESTVKDYLWTELTVNEDYDYGEDYLSGIDFDSSLTCSSGNVGMISCPLLLMGHTAGYEYIAAEWSYHRALSKDKTIAFMEGATHGWTAIDADTYGDTLDIEARYVAQWLGDPERFPAPVEERHLDRTSAEATVVDTERLRAALIGSWSGGSPSHRAQFAATGGSELGFAAALSRFEIQPDGALHFHDRYGDTTAYRFTPDAVEAKSDARTYYLDDENLILQAVALFRSSDD